jgi:hypothetical protein
MANAHPRLLCEDGSIVCGVKMAVEQDSPEPSIAEIFPSKRSL